MPEELVTIGITAFNAQETIVRAVQSALLQDWSPIEVIVVDDCSTDKTVECIRAAVMDHANVRLVCHGQNLGVAVARNTVIREAAGRFIAFFDDDDISHPNRVTAQVRRIRDYERTLPPNTPVICHTARQQIYPDGTSRIETTIGMRTGRTAPFGPAVALRILKGTPLRDGFGSCATCSQMARRSVYEVVGGFDPTFRRSEDTEFCVRLALQGAHFVGIDKPLVTQTMAISSEKTLDEELIYCLAIVEKHYALFGNDTEPRIASEWLRLKYQSLSTRRGTFIHGLLRLGARHPLYVLRRILYALPASGSRLAIRRLHRS